MQNDYEIFESYLKASKPNNKINEAISEREVDQLIQMLYLFISKYEVKDLSEVGSIIGDAAWKAVNKVYSVASKDDIDKFTNAIINQMK